MQLDSGSKRSALVCRFANEDGKTAKSVRDAAGSLTKSSRGSSAGFTSLSAALISNRGDNQGLTRWKKFPGRGHEDTELGMDEATSTLLARLTGKAAVPRDDALWQTLLTAKVPLQRGGSTSVADLEQITQNFCAQLLRNNAATGNFQTLLVCTLDHLELAQAEPVTQAQLESACSAVMLVTIILRHMVETLEAEARP